MKWKKFKFCSLWASEIDANTFFLNFLLPCRQKIIQQNIPYTDEMKQWKWHQVFDWKRRLWSYIHMMKILFSWNVSTLILFPFCVLFWKFDWFFRLQQQNHIVDAVLCIAYTQITHGKSIIQSTISFISLLWFLQTTNNHIMCVKCIVLCLEMLVNPHAHTFSLLSSLFFLLQFLISIIKSNRQYFLFNHIQPVTCRLASIEPLNVYTRVW